jgi:predicted alpha-1,2-mannosidase
MKNLYKLLCFILVAGQSVLTFSQDYTRYVDPFIGTGYHGHVFLGANVPFGSVQAGPTNFIHGWDWCSGYHYSDSIVTGFSQTHLNGTGIGDLGDVLLTPFTGDIKTSIGSPEKPFSGYASLYSHKQEIARPGYYSVILKTFGIQAEMTATERVGIHKYTFPETENAYIAINLEDGIGWDQPVEGSLQQLDSVTFIGYRFSKGWAKDQRLWFAIKISKPAKSFVLYDQEQKINDNKLTARTVKGFLNYKTQKGDFVIVKVALSPVSSQNALKNLETEAPQWNFEKYASNALTAWNNELKKVQVVSGNESYLRTFYTALYHAYTTPSLFCDKDGSYQGADRKSYPNPGYQTYSVFSLWDTYRAEHPMLTILQPQRASDMINTMLQIYKQQGKLPIWHLMGNETDCMVGYSAVPVITDAIFKGIKGIDPNLALEAMKASSMRDDYGVDLLKKNGYIAADKEKESVSKALEYAISDWCIGQLAAKLGKTDDFKYYQKRGQAYSLYFDTGSKFMKPKLADGKFREPFSPFKSIHEWGDYTEGNAWQYTWLVPQDVEGLINLFGSKKAFTQKLDSLFIVKGDLGDQASPDISGLIGQYAHGNEPSHHIIYLYAYVGQPWKTAEKSREILTTLYTDKTDGLCGNEDCGQMSAWYVLSSMGLYQVNPANGCYIFGSPLFDKVTLALPGGKSFEIKAINNSHKNIYIQSAKLNGKDYKYSYIRYSDIMNGGVLEFTMGDKPSASFGTGKFVPKSNISGI